MTIDGKEVLQIRPDFAEAPDITGTRFSTMVGIGSARRTGFFPGKVPLHAIRHKYVLRGTIAKDYEKFFNDRAGRWQSFLLPSWVYELSNGTTNTTGSSSGQPNLRIDWCDYGTYFDPTHAELTRLGHYIFILWPDGTTFFSRVNSMGANSAGVFETLVLATNLPLAVGGNHDCIIGFCYSVRFADDELDMEFRGPNCALCDVGYAEVATSTPEADIP
jgi:hypothetical protein